MWSFGTTTSTRRKVKIKVQPFTLTDSLILPSILFPLFLSHLFQLPLSHIFYFLSSSFSPSFPFPLPLLRYGNCDHNQPCIHSTSHCCFITTQNHGFTVDSETLPAEWSILFTNANNKTNEGIVNHFSVSNFTQSTWVG